MTIKVTVQDSIISDLFEVSFNDNLFNGLTKYIKSEPVYKWDGHNATEVGRRWIMKHTDLIKLMEEMAL